MAQLMQAKAPGAAQTASRGLRTATAWPIGRPVSFTSQRQAGFRHTAPWVVRAEREPSTSTQADQQASDQPKEDLPPWVRAEKQRELQAKQGGGIPWPLLLIMSGIIAIASVGSIFEYIDKNPIFGVVQPDSPLWAPILGFFALTGLPLSGFLFFTGVNAANEAAEAQDRIDGYLDD